MKEIKLSEKDIKRFWSHVRVGTPNECWEWKASKFHNGYGSFSANHQTLKAHRVAYVLKNGAFSDGYQAHHICSNKSCCNPSHLESLSVTEHTERTMALGQLPVGARNGQHTHPERTSRGNRHWTRLYPERIARGESHIQHIKPELALRGEENGMAKVNKEQVEQIRAMRKQGVFQRVIAKLFGISQGQVSSIQRGASWKDS